MAKRYPPLVLSPEEIAYLVSNPLPMGQSFHPQSQATAIAIILAESGGNVYALNDVPPDESYGLAQINMRGQLGPERRARYNLASNEDLYKADLNVAIMAHLSGAGSDFRPWTVWLTKAYVSHLGTAQKALKNPKNPTGRLQSPEEIAAGNDPFERLLKWAGQGTLRIAGFVGGGILVLLAIVFYVRGVK